MTAPNAEVEPLDVLPAPDEAVRKTLGLSGGVKWRRRVLTLLVLGGLGYGGLHAYQQLNEPPPPPSWRTAGVSRGDILITVGATGSVEPLTTVDVGPEISGRVIAVEADWNEHVDKGQVLIRLDTEPLAAQLEQAQAQLAASAATVQQAAASFTEAKLADERMQKLTKQGLESAERAETTKAARARAFASLDNARAQKRLSEARVKQVQTDLDRAVIKSPIDGVVLLRAVEPGNAVAASLQTPVLFKIAEDLTRMELRLAIDEADVAKVQPGMEASFTVDAYPDQRFAATVKAVRYAPVVTQNVVTYEAVLSVDNGELKLRPGMTATATITASAVRDVLKVPNTALRFRPPRPEGESAPSAGRGGMPGMPMLGGRGFGGGRGGGRGGQATARAGGGERAGGERTGGRGARVWVLRDGEPTPVRVQTGATDSAFTEVTGGELTADDRVLVGVEEAAR